MALRISLAVVSVLAVAWLGVLLRDQVIGDAAFEHLRSREGLPPHEVARDIQRLEDAELLSPDKTWLLYRAGYLSVRDPRRSSAELEPLVRSEPENSQAWSLLLVATSSFDKTRSKQALEHIKQLAPHKPPVGP